MEALSQTIRQRIKTDQDIYVIKPADLIRLWPNLEDTERYKQVAAFVEKHGWKLYAYHRGTGAFIIKG